MRLSPTKDQLEYLASIGIPDYVNNAPVHAISRHPQTGQARRRRRIGIKGVVIILAIAAILFLLIAYPAHGEGTLADSSRADSRALPINTVGRSVQSGQDSLIRRKSTPKKLQERKSESDEKILRATQQDGTQKARNQPSGRDSIIIRSGEMVSPPGVTVDNSKYITPSMNTLVQKYWWMIEVVEKLALLITIIALALVYRRLRNLEEKIQGLHSARGGMFKARNRESESARQIGTPIDRKSGFDDLLIDSVVSGRPDALSPSQTMDQIIAVASGDRSIRIKPHIPTDLWSLGLASIKGNVRSENQDFGLCFRIGERDVMIIADGCGGIPHGRRAAYVAAVAAASWIIRAYGTWRRWNLNPRAVSINAIYNAARCLSIEGRRMNIVKIPDGLRTTLIVAVSTEASIEYAYIGDGGGYLIRTKGDVQKFLQPQKAGESMSNVLAASLGPVVEGKPQMGKLVRSPGDLVIVGTDGVFDRTELNFPMDVLRGCIARAGFLGAAAQAIVEELAQFKDNEGYICDDNLTLGLMGTGVSPRLSEGFWFHRQLEDAAVNNM